MISMICPQCHSTEEISSARVYQIYENSVPSVIIIRTYDRTPKPIVGNINIELVISPQPFQVVSKRYMQLVL
jgi:hypothetical protein